MKEINVLDFNMIHGGKQSKNQPKKSPWSQLGRIGAGVAAGAVTGGIAGCALANPATAGVGVIWGGIAGGASVVHFQLYKD